MLGKIRERLRAGTLLDRVVFTVAALSFLAVCPMLVARIIERNWFMVTLDAILLVMFAFIAVNVMRGRYLDVSRRILGVFMVLGMIGTTTMGDTGNAYWLYPGFIAIFFMFSPIVALSIAVLVSVTVFPFLYERFAATNLFTLYATLLPTVLFIYFFSKDLRAQHKTLSMQATEDYLTQTGNRRAFNDEAQLCIDALNKSNASNVLILFDMDHFKRLNDAHGHVTGDSVLKDVSNIVQGCLRSTDKLYRLGGEEFGIIVRHALLSDALGIAQKIRQSIDNNKNEHLPDYTVSFGIAELLKNESVEDWMSRADKALYQSKQNGRDQISIA
ncbi:GGDEF domain-containing protein [Glaciecola siphonariae]|uniref:diguanylate cyclase n=1 Tax=Glaciecola siphonariae TaxID=521012 RepID=A0ABV9LRB5_9ALTE